MSVTSTSDRGLRAAVLLPLLVVLASLAAALVGTPSASAAGTGTITGTVRNNAGSPIAASHVFLDDLGQQAVTGTDGKYTIFGVPFGDHTLRFTTVCKGSRSRSFTSDGNETIDLTVENRFTDDTFGHSCRPASFALLTGQTSLPLTGDDKSLSMALPFGFPFYGITKSAVAVSTNGYLTFGNADATAHINLPPGDPSAPFDAIFVFWDDLVADASSSISTTTVGTAPNRTFMVEWKNMTFFDKAGSRVTFQVQLFENGTILMGYRDLDGSDREQGSSATIGLRNGVSTSSNAALTESFNDRNLVDGTKTLTAHNDVPVANAGADKTVTSGAGFTLDGTKSTDDQGNANLSSRWKQTGGAVNPAIQNKQAAKTTVQGVTGPRKLTYQLTVTDPFGRSSTDTVIVTVKAP